MPQSLQPRAAQAQVVADHRCRTQAHGQRGDQIASHRLEQIQNKLADLKRMQKVLTHLVGQCEHTRAELPCPIIATLATRTAAPANDQRAS